MSHDRLDRLAGLLRSRSMWTAVELAQALAVSLRTVRRDLAALAARGAPIQAERGRGGGVSLSADWGLRRLELAPREVLDLLLALAVSESLRSPLLLASVRALRQKLTVAFPEAERRRVNMLRRRILVGAPASPDVVAKLGAPRPAALAALQSAFFAQRPVELRYCNERGVRATRLFEPHYLLLNWPAWYTLGWDHLRGAARMLRVDRIEACSPREGSFALAEAATLMAEVGTFFAGL